MASDAGLPSTPRWPFHLIAALSLACATPAQAAQELDVQLQLDLKPALEAEQKLKGMLDEWATVAFDVQFTPRPELDPTMPGLVRVRLEGLTVAFNPAWYGKYKAMHDALIAQPYAAGALARAAIYCRQGDGRLRATLLDAGGKTVFADGIFNTLAPSHFQPVEAHLFPTGLLRPLPDEPPGLLQLLPLPPGETPYVLVPAKVLPSVKKIRVGDLAERRWPVELRDPTAPAPPGAPPVPGAPAGGKPPAGASPAAPPPGGDAPKLTPPKL